MVSKKQQVEYFKEILNKGICKSLVKERKEDYEKLMELFKNHPEYPNKLKDVVDIVVTKNKRNSKYYEFNLIRQDGSIEDISYRCCINPRNEKHNLLSAMRNSVQPQIDDFRKSVPRKCEICEKTNDIHIDHIYMFQYLVNDFLTLMNKTDIPDTFDNNIDNTSMFKKKDINFSAEWNLYHLHNATLRPLCSKSNLSRKWLKGCII